MGTSATKKAKRIAATKSAAAELRAAGFKVVIHFEEGRIMAEGPHGIGYQFHPLSRVWHYTGRGRAGNKNRHGTTATIIADHRVQAAHIERLKKVKTGVTLFADAAFDSKTGCAGWGAWIKGRSETSITAAGEFADLLASSIEAEIRALANGLHVAIKRGVVARGAVVMLQSDCITALAWILYGVANSQDRPAEGGLPVEATKRPQTKAAHSAGLRCIVDAAKAHDLIILTRHVRGHMPGPNRQWVNRLCDAEAKKAKKSRLQRHLAEKEKTDAET